MKKLVLIGALLVLARPVWGAGLTDAARLASIYDTILRARFAEARDSLAHACPPAPREACLAIASSAIWWELQIDPDSRALDRKLQDSAADAIAAATTWTEREPRRAEAWFYLAGAYAPLTQWRILRGERLAAARDAVKVKNALERALALDPTLTDAYFGIGVYHYYADVAPSAVKMLRWLLLLPGGDREQGLREMLKARDSGVLLRGEADFQLHYVYLWYEKQTDRALDLLRGLDARYPSNPIFLQRIAEVQRDYRHDHTAAQAAWDALLERARSGRVEFAAISDTRARLGIAAALIERNDLARVPDLLAPVVAARATAPLGALAQAHLLLGRAYDARGDRARAAASYTAAIDTAPRDDPDRIRARARTALTRMQNSRARNF